MKYKLSPLHFIGLFSLSYGVYFQFEVSKHNGVGLGGLIPYTFIGAAVGVLVIDLIIQLIFRNNKLWFYVAEFLIVFLGVFAFLKAQSKQTLIITEKRPQYIRLIYDVTGQPKLSTNFFKINYDIEVPSYGTILTSTAIEKDNDYFNFEWRDETKVTGNWGLIPIESNGKYYCKERDRFINYRLWYLSATNTWQMDSSWVESANTDFETAKQLSIQCQY